MLFAYPADAASVNWLHDTLADTLRRGVDDIDAGRPKIAWPACLALEFRERLRRFSRLEERLDALLASYSTLGDQARLTVREAMEDQSMLAELFGGMRQANRLDDLAIAIRLPVQHLFEQAFDMLRPLGIRDENYKVFLRLVQHRICAFCGCEYFSGANSKRDPLDHYLAISLYPFAGANARNLVPMGPKCNSSYKLAQDVLRSRAGVRRPCFDPYSDHLVGVRLTDTILFAREDGLPEWRVALEGDEARLQTWDEVFDIRRRFIDDHLDSIYKNAIKVFATLTRRRPDIVTTATGLSGAFSHLADLSRAKEWSDRAFLEVALY